jgi:flagellin-like protein
MRSKIKTLPLAAYIAIAGFFQGLKKDERGLSGIVVTILLILVAILAVVLFWGLLGDLIQSLWAKITGAADQIS